MLKKVDYLFLAGFLLAALITAGAAAAQSQSIAGISVKVLPSQQEVVVPQKAIDTSPMIGEVIVPNPSLWQKASLWLKGCQAIQAWKDGASFKCSPKTAETLISQGKARENRLFQLHDLQADEQINADDVWNLGFEGNGVKVAVLDTGVDQSHIELGDSVLATANFIKGPGFDSEGHGTHVSGIITGNGVHQINGNRATGVSPEAGLLVGKVCASYGCPEDAILAGIEWAVSQGADVLNLSLGGGNFSGHCDEDPAASKVNWAVNQGVVVVVSAGNEGLGVSSPACASGAIAVGAVNQSNVETSWSNYGPALDIMAPGVDILSTYSCKAAGDCRSYWYAYMSGTSMSAPHIAGAAALVLEKNPTYSVADVKEAIYQTALDLGSSGWDEQTGWGRVDALAAVNYQKICTSNDDCDDRNACTENICIAETGQCQFTEITQCANNDGCCPAGCDYTNDNDCQEPTPCGDGYCAGYLLGENCLTCPQDCLCLGKNCSKACCGDGVCRKENINQCPVDCS